MKGAPAIHIGDCLDILRTLPENSVDSIVTDPPYGLKFMGKRWDYDVPGVEVWAECLRVLRPGGHLLAFAGTRTQHRMCTRIEDAGFEIRDMIAWVYGSGFPKSLDVSKAIDKAAGASRNVVGSRTKYGLGGSHTFAQDAWTKANQGLVEISITEPATDASRQWQGWGTALKPALEPITVARKPLEGTVAANVLAHGTGALNINGCRVGTEGSRTNSSRPNVMRVGVDSGMTKGTETVVRDAGRWPANLIHDGSDEVLQAFPHTGPTPGSYETSHRDTTAYSGSWPERIVRKGHKDAGGSATRFFYCAKASKRDRDEGLEGFDAKPAASAYGEGLNTATKVRTAEQVANGVSRDLRRNTHTTVKPTDLMRYLCRLVTPPGGVVLDPFMGSGSTGKAAVLEGFGFIGIEREAEYAAIAEARIAHATEEVLAKAAAPSEDPAQIRLFGDAA